MKTSKNRTYKDGNICRIYMKNFLTYDNVEIFPQPHLNVIIGPNGTGKSSVLCGICIGLGGKPELTGRGKSLVEYIKHGKSFAAIEIELFSFKGQNIIIRREFNKDNKSRWHLQNQESSEKQILAKVATLNIQVNNLCQFLPQDRVKEFSTLNKVQLLSSTEMAVGETELYEQHEKLSKYGKTLNDLREQLKFKSDLLANEIKKNCQLEDQVRNIEKMDKLDALIKKYNLLISFCHYKEARKKLKEFKSLINKCIKECQALNSRIEPHQKKIDEINKKLRLNQEELKKLDTKDSSDFHQEISKLNSQFGKKEEEILQIKAKFDHNKTYNIKVEAEINDLKKQIDAVMDQIKQIEPVDESVLAHQIKVLTDDIARNSQTVSRIRQEKENATVQINALNEEARRYSEHLRNAQDISTRKLQILQTANRWVFQATQWLQNNRNLFKGNVHDPLYSQIDLIDQTYAKYLESTVSRPDLVAFVCENKFDVKIFKTIADKHGWRINILHSEPIDSSLYKPKIPIENISKFGFLGYLKDVISAPLAIVSYLCRTYHIHNIPYANKANYEAVPDSITLMFIANDRISLRYSRYDKQRLTSISCVNDVVYLRLSKDPRKEEEFKINLESLNKRIEAMRTNHQRLSQDEQRVDQDLERLRGAKREKSMFTDPRKQLEATANRKRDQIVRRHQSIVDIAKEKRDMDVKIKKIIGEMKLLNELQSKLESKVTSVAENYIYKSFTTLFLQIEKRKINKSMEDYSSDKIDKEEEKENLMAQVKEYENNAKINFDKLRMDLGSKPITPEVELNLSKECDVISSISGTSERRIDDLQNKLADVEARRNVISTTDPSIVDEFNRREERIRSLRKDEAQMSAYINNETESIESCQNSWLPTITDLTHRISEHFAEFMSRLNCAGEVTLDKGNDEDDFSNYGLVIKVKFRDDAKLKEFSEYQQSGGEKSIITAFYLMALQTLTAVPFRCVDEINQGMDPTNERKMFTMLVESTTSLNASQYFLITPKLLPNLPYNAYVSFINAWNAAHAESNIITCRKISKYYVRKRSSIASSRK